MVLMRLMTQIEYLTMYAHKIYTSITVYYKSDIAAKPILKLGGSPPHLYSCVCDSMMGMVGHF